MNTCRKKVPARPYGTKGSKYYEGIENNTTCAGIYEDQMTVCGRYGRLKQTSRVRPTTRTDRIFKRPIGYWYRSLNNVEREY